MKRLRIFFSTKYTVTIGHSNNNKNPLHISYILHSSVHFIHSVLSDSLQPHESHTACQASLSITSSQSSLQLMSVESAMPSSHLIFCCPLLLLPLVPPSIRVFSSETALHIRWSKYWSFILQHQSFQ